MGEVPGDVQDFAEVPLSKAANPAMSWRLVQGWTRGLEWSPAPSPGALKRNRSHTEVLLLIETYFYKACGTIVFKAVVHIMCVFVKYKHINVHFISM